MLRRLIPIVAAAAAACAMSASAQLRSVEMTFTGAGCEPCLQSLPNRAQRLRGVESATVDAARGMLSMRLAAANRVRLEQVRDLIQQDGTKAVAAKVEVSGTLEKPESASEWVLRVPQWPQPLRLAASPSAASGWKQGDAVTLQGRVANLAATPLLLEDPRVIPPAK